jgi:hypothetical protein
MPTFIKTGLWEKTYNPALGYKGWLNLDELIKCSTPTSTIVVSGTGTGSMLRCGLGNTASGYESISFGSCNFVTGANSASLFGIANCVVDCRSVSSGLNNVVSQNDSYIFGGSFNTISNYAPISTTVSGYFDGFCNGVTVLYGSYGDLTSQFGAGTTVSSQYTYGFPEQPIYLNMTVCGSSYNPATCETTLCVDPSINTCSGYFVKRGPYTASSYYSSFPNVIVGGAFNTLSCYVSAATMIGGCFNTASGYTVTIGGDRNINQGYSSVMIGGSSSCALGGGIMLGSSCSTLGQFAFSSSIISSNFSSIGVVDNYGVNANIYGGQSNSICKTCVGQIYFTGGNIVGSSGSCIENTIGNIFGGGSNVISNKAQGEIFGGALNIITTTYTSSGGYSSYGRSVIIGGQGNTICGSCANIPFVGCGTITGLSSTISGGNSNTIFGNAYQSNIGGGIGNCITSCWDTIGGGLYHCVTGGYSVVAGGGCNCVFGIGAAIGGGFCNIVNCSTGTIAGGRNSTMSGRYATIGGGRNHTVSGYGAFAGGGRLHIASSNYTTIGGGYQNTTSSNYASVVGGRGNTASGIASSVLGGCANTTSGFDCAMIVGSNITANRVCATFVNNLSIMNVPTSSAGLPSGSVWRDTTDGDTLKIVP